MLELGIVVHSVIIGMDLGVKTDKASAIVGLVIALCFHQFFEGLGLGACIANVMHDQESKVKWSKVRRCFHDCSNLAQVVKLDFQVIMMVAVFSLTLPLGGALGMISIAAESFHADNLFQPWLQVLTVCRVGTLDAISGGVLVYLAFIHFISEDFNRKDVDSRENVGLRWLMILSVILGATCMSLLALQA
eukprot:749189-Hanusia_phi.AAC.1